MNVGFTGTRSGMTNEQQDELAKLLKSIDSDEMIDEFHHGDCIGADKQAHDIVRHVLPWTSTVAHPGLDHKGESPLAAHTKSDVIMPPKKYLRRNTNIVKASDIMIACPAQAREMKRGSGTWHTIRECRRLGKPVTIIYPDGRTRAIQSNKDNLQVSGW